MSDAQGRKDRYTTLSKKRLPVLRDYFKEYHPKEWLFERAKGRQYSVLYRHYCKRCLHLNWYNKESFDPHLAASFGNACIGKQLRFALYTKPDGARKQQNHRDLHLILQRKGSTRYKIRWFTLLFKIIIIYLFVH